LAERTEIFQKVSDAVVKDKPYVPLLFSQVAAVARKEVQGVRTSDRFWPTEVDVDRIWLKQG
jgi:ABC-type transport system substrate-binding protein